MLFKMTKIQAMERLDLLAGLMWVHAHKEDLHVVWSAASVAQHRLLAAALRLNYDKLSKTEPWLTTVVRRVLASALLVATPREAQGPKRRRGGPDSGAGRSPVHLGPRLFEAVQDYAHQEGRQGAQVRRFFFSLRCGGRPL